MSLVRGQEDQPAGVAVGTAGQQMGNFRAISEATGADEMKGPLSRGQRPKATGNRGGCHNGGIGRGAGGRPAAGILATGVDEMKGPLSPGQRPKITGSLAQAAQQHESGQRTGGPTSRGSRGDGRPADGKFQDGLMQESEKLQRMAQQHGKRQQMVLDGCGGEAEEECCGEDSRNGGAAACAAANKRPEKQRLPVVAAFGRSRTARMAPMVWSGGTDSRSEESSDSEGADLNGGAAACAAAIDAVNKELRELQDRTVELVLMRRRLEEQQDALSAEEQEQQDAENEEWSGMTEEQRQDALGAEMQEQQDAETFKCTQEEATVTVGNLALGVTGSILAECYEQIGEVQGAKILEECGPDWRPLGIVTFTNPEDAEEAQQRFDGVELAGRAMVVRMEGPREEEI
jgi:hypothetical protein